MNLALQRLTDGMDRLTICWLIVAWFLMGASQAIGQSTEKEPSPRQLIESAHQAAVSLQSYRYKLTSITRHKGSNGSYQGEKKNVLNYTFRDPNQVRLQWLSPRRKRGQLAAYNGKILRAAPTWMPFAVTVDPDSPTGMDDFHHPIYRSDLASLTTIMMQGMAKVIEEAYEGQVAVGQRTAHRVVLHTEDKRVVVLIDKEHFLPLVIEQYDRETGLLFDGGYFEDIEFNPPLDDSLFDL
jgi:outer membrane lipoprotein-sorting protein